MQADFPHPDGKTAFFLAYIPHGKTPGEMSKYLGILGKIYKTARPSRPERAQRAKTLCFILCARPGYSFAANEGILKIWQPEL